MKFLTVLFWAAFPIAAFAQPVSFANLPGASGTPSSTTFLKYDGTTYSFAVPGGGGSPGGASGQLQYNNGGAFGGVAGLTYSGTTITIPSGYTLNVASGGTISNNGTATGFPGTGTVTNWVDSTGLFNVATSTTTPTITLINALNAASGLVQLNSSDQYPALNGSLITGIPVLGANTFTGTQTVPNLIDSGLTANTVPYANGSQQLASATIGSSLSLSSGTLSVATITTGLIMSNISGSTAVATGHSISSLMDSVTSSTTGGVFCRGSSWTALGAGTTGQRFQTQGTAGTPLWVNPVTMTSNSTGTATFNSSSNSETIYDSSSTTVAALTITLPTTSIPGQLCSYATAAIVTTITMAGGTVDIGSALTASPANGVFIWECDVSGHWIRMQ